MDAALDIVHAGMGSDLMALCGKVEGINGNDQVRLAYEDDQVTCARCLLRRIEQLKATAIAVNP